MIPLDDYTHQGSKKNLLGKNPPADLGKFLSNEQQITAQNPTFFIRQTVADQAVPVENALLFASALIHAMAPFDLTIYQKGQHGLGLPATGSGPPRLDTTCLYWLNQRFFECTPALNKSIRRSKKVESTDEQRVW